MKYAAFLRGIGPGDPRMSNESLRGLFESLGFQQVQTVISSGNVLFETNSNDPGALEKIIEKALPERLGFSKAVFVRSQEELREIVNRQPFGSMKHSPKTNLNLTFLRKPQAGPWKLPYETKAYSILSINGRTVFSVVDTSNNQGSELMRQLEKTFGSENTTRTLLTVQRILHKWGDH